MSSPKENPVQSVITDRATEIGENLKQHLENTIKGVGEHIAGKIKEAGEISTPDKTPNYTGKNSGLGR